MPENAKEKDTLSPTLPSASLPDVVDVESATFGDGTDASRYQSQRLLGQGGMGEVHLCRDARIGRDIAVKKMKPAALSRPNSVARFLREARIQGQLEHPAVVPVYDLGKNQEGAPYFTMKRVRGLTLEEIIEALCQNDPEIKERYSRRKLLSAFSSVCLAVDFVHSRGVLHRDLKPANVMLGDFGEVHILDWGIAKVKAPDLPSDEAHEGPVVSTRLGQAMGSPGYMSPEQARGEHDLLDARSDVYSLGAILFELLTLQRLHMGQSIKEVMDSILGGYQDIPSQRAPEADIPPELDSICVKATAPSAASRFASARELSEQIEDFLDGDRDLAKRREMAEKHAAKAESALVQLEESKGSDKEARVKAMKEATRALALDPEHQKAAGILARLLMEVPTEIPPEAAEEMQRSTIPTRQMVAKLSSARAVAVVLALPLFLWVGVKDWALLFFVASLMLLMAALNWFWWKSRTQDARFGYFPFAVSIALISMMSVLMGPILLVPALATINGAFFLLQSDFRMRRPVVLLSALPVGLPVLLQYLGLISPMLEMEDGAIISRSLSLALEPEGFIWFVAFFCMLTSILPLFLLVRLRAGLAEVEKKLFLHSWHLKQMIPDDAKNPR